MSAPQTMAEAVKLIDDLRAELKEAKTTIEVLRYDRDTWRAISGR